MTARLGIGSRTYPAPTTDTTWREVLRPYRWPAAGYVAVLLAAAAVGTASPIVVGGIVTALGRPAVDPAVVLGLVGTFVGVSLLGSSLGVATRWISDAISQRVIAAVRSLVFARLQRLPLTFFAHNPTGSIVSRLSTDLAHAQSTVIGPVNATVTNGAQLVLAVVAVASLSVPVALAVLLAVPLVWLPSRWFAPRILGLQRRLADANASTMALMTERFGVAGATLVKLFADPRRESARFEASASEIRCAEIRMGMTTQLYSASFSIVSVVGQAMVYLVGGYLVLEGALSAGAIIAMSLLLTRIYPPLQAMASAPADLSRARVAMERIGRLWSVGGPALPRQGTAPLPDGPLSVRLSDVHFAYGAAGAMLLDPTDGVGTADGTHAALRGIDLDVPAGASVALVGPSGSGKSTVAALVSGLLLPDRGRVEIGGVDVCDADPDQLRDAVGLVLQDSHFLHGTIAENLRFARPEATTDELWDVLEAAELTELVMHLPSELETVLGEQGSTLSGGERQRLAVARVLLRRPRLLVLDEATAHLDADTAASVRNTLRSTMYDCTCIVITHSSGDLDGIDQVVELHDGRSIVGERSPGPSHRPDAHGAGTV